MHSRRSKPRLTSAVAACALFSTCSLASAAVQYNAPVYLGELGTKGATPQSVNDFGVVTGFSPSSAGVTTEFVYTPGSGIKAIGPLPGATGSSSGYGINDSGTIVGTSTTPSSSNADATEYANGTLSDIGSIGGLSTVAYAINASGVVAGYGVRTVGGNMGFIEEPGGTLSPIGTAATGGAGTSELFAINANGFATGISSTGTGSTSSGVVYNSNTGTFTTFAAPGTTVSAIGKGININNEVVGTSTNLSNFTSVAFANTVASGTVALGTLEGGAGSSTANGINDAGSIVGGASVSSTVTDGYVDTLGGTMTDLNTLIAPGSGWVLGTAYSISNSGDIVGVGTFNGVANQAYLLTPVPEPASIGVLAVGGLLLARRPRQRV